MIIALALRVALLGAAMREPQRLMTPDSRAYVDLSNSLATGQFGRDDRPEIEHTPGYPFFLSVTVSHDWWLVAAGAQIALDTMLVYATFLLGSLLVRPAVGLWAAAMQAASPLAIAASVRVLSDSLYALLLALAILLLVHYGCTRKQWPLLVGCLVAALACYVRPIGLLWLGLVLAMLAAKVVAAVWRRRPWREPASALLVAAVVFGVVLAPWVHRNVQVAGYWGFSSIGTTNLLRYEAAGTLASVEGVDLREAQSRLERRLDDARRTLSEADTPAGTVAAERRIALQVIGNHPWVWLRTHVITSLASLLPGVTDVLEIAGARPGQQGTLAVLQHEGIAAAVRTLRRRVVGVLAGAAGRGGAGGQYLLAMAAVVAVSRRRGHSDFRDEAAKIRESSSSVSPYLMIGLTVAVFLLAGGPASTARFRVPVEPEINIAAAMGLMCVLRR